MKKILPFVISALAVLSTASCTKLPGFFSRAFGSTIVFGSSKNSGSDTRVAYSGVVGANKYERIDWVAGDKLRIYCPEASEPSVHYADYVITSGSVSSYGTSGSSAKIEIEPGKSGLKWGEPGMHHFASLYPAPGTGVDGTAVKENAVTCVIPQVQTCYGAISGSSSKVAAPDPKYIYLAGYAEAMAGTDGTADGEPVNIYYDPAVSTFEFVLQNNYDSKSDMTVKKVGITTSKAGAVLCGTYDVDVTKISASAALAVTEIGEITGETSQSVSMEFDSAVVIPYGETFTFTLFVQPGYNISHLTFWFVDESKMKRSYGFKYKDPTKGDEGWVEFIALHKSKLKGIMAPESAGWTINTVPVITSWDGSDNRDIDIDYGQVLTFETPEVVGWETGEGGDLILKDKK